MKNHWLDKRQPGVISAPLDYGDPSLDFFSAKDRIIQYLRARYPVDQIEDVNEFFSNSIFMDLIDNWAYCADLLSQERSRP